MLIYLLTFLHVHFHIFHQPQGSIFLDHWNFLGYFVRSQHRIWVWTSWIVDQIALAYIDIHWVVRDLSKFQICWVLQCNFCNFLDLLDVVILQIYYICDIIKVFSATLVHISLYDIISFIKKKNYLDRIYT